MNYSLWRNGELLGELVLPLPASSPGLIAGILKPTSAFADITPLTQIRMPHLTGAPVLEAFLTDLANGPYALEPLTAEAAAGIAPAAILELRATGESVPIDSIWIERIPLPPAGSPGEFADACVRCGLEGTAWVVSAHRS